MRARRARDVAVRTALEVWTGVVIFAGACAMLWGLLCLAHALTARTIRAVRWRIAQRRMWRQLAWPPTSGKGLLGREDG